MKIQSMVCITNIPGDDASCRQNPDLKSGIYVNVVMESECHIIAENMRNKYKEKKIQHG